jgi:hypothetical protein
MGLTILMAALPTFAAGEGEAGWKFYGSLGGSSNASGVILRVDPSVGYAFNRYVETYVGLPIYFVKESTASSRNSASGLISGIGNAYFGVQLSVDNPAVNYTSNVVFSAPTGDRERGFSTGRATVDWNNGFSRSFSSVTPFANVGLANTVSDTSFFVRPFTSLGLVSHFEGGAEVGIAPAMRMGASAYAVRASGEQQIVSKVVRPASQGPAGSSRGRGLSARERVFETVAETRGPAEIANDHGFSAWLSIIPQSTVNFQMGYSRSARYQFDTFFFGIGFRVGK